VSGTVIAQLQVQTSPEADVESEEDDIENAGPLQIAVDLDEPTAPAG